jgi:hypothetical protein
VFAGYVVISAIMNVYVGYLCSMQFHPAEIAAWSNVYFFVITLVLLPIYAYAGLQKGVHSFADLFWFVVILTKKRGGNQVGGYSSKRKINKKGEKGNKRKRN